MSLVDVPRREELLDASDAEIEDAVTYADPMVLRGLLFQLTGDEELLDVELDRQQGGFFISSVIKHDADIEMIRRKTVEFLKSYRDDGAGEIGPGPEERLPRSLGLTVGEEIPEEALPLWTEELALDPWARSLEWSREPDPKQLENFKVIVVGCGLGGLNASLMLKRAGIPFEVIEKNDGVGGTWHENRYPGARVDSPSRSYTHIYGVDFQYPNPFCGWEENKKYFDWVADTFDLRDHVTFETEVLRMTWDEGAKEWEVHTRSNDGKTETTRRANAVITSVGFLNRPRTPDFEGMEEFQGESFHTARWPEDLDVEGKKIVVIGTGCTGYQTIPELALVAEQVTVFQRTPQWLNGIPGYRSPFPAQVNWLDRNLPYHTNFMRHRSTHGVDSIGEMTTIDPDFADEHTLSEANKAMRDATVEFVTSKLKDTHPELIDAMIPQHPPFSARPVMVDTEYSILDALNRDNVELVTNGVKKIVSNGVMANDGTVYEADIIVYAIGFHATEYLFPMEIVGTEGTTIGELWSKTGAQAYHGCMMPGFPNLWSLYGPNTNGGLNVAGYHELVTVYALQCLEKLILEDKGAVEVKREPYERFNKLVDERNATKVWSDPRAHNYYWTEFGRSAVMSPFQPVEIYKQLRHPDFADLDVR
jgi:4-hydroxyacetophenone monooxygenase